MTICLNHMGLLLSELGEPESAVHIFDAGMAILNAMTFAGSGMTIGTSAASRRFDGNLANLLPRPAQE